MFRKIEGVDYTRERLELIDGDFVDLDWVNKGSDKLVIISHGLEGNSTRHYVKGMAKYFAARGYDALAWNCRSCSGEINRLPRFYHHGDTGDLRAVINHAAATNRYSEIVLVGLSMGGSMTVKYLGEGGDTSNLVTKAVVYSVPCHLSSSAKELDKPSKRFYRDRFMRKLSKKIQMKAALFPDVVSHAGFENIKTFKQFDDRYTAPLHGFDDAEDFYRRASAQNYLDGLQRPVLLVNALNDSFLTKQCYPFEAAQRSRYLYLETPATGGHVGFTLGGKEENWMEVRAFEWSSK
jgi:predicted alpha/beta-fold hydrolase